MAAHCVACCRFLVSSFPRSSSGARGWLIALVFTLLSTGVAHAQWTDVTMGFLGDAGSGTTASFDDFNGDGAPDLYIVNSNSTNKFLVNVAGFFFDFTAAPVDDAGNGTAVTWADDNGDGRPDLFLLNLTGGHRFLNLGSNVFTESTPGPLAAASGTSAAWVDYDGDGDLDLYNVLNGANTMYRNDGGGTYTPITTGPLGDASNGMQQAWFDFDNDGDLDVYIVNFQQSNRLLRNDGAGSFTDVTYGPLADATGWGVAAAVGDYDNDGRLDLYIVNSYPANRLLRNLGGGAFADSTQALLALPANNYFPRSGVWGDFDNDGDLDLFVTNSLGKDFLFRNDLGTFSADSTGVLGGTSGTFNAAAADYDGDGDLDLYKVNSGANQLLRNDHPAGNHWLDLTLVGTLSNTSSVGARVRVKAGGKWQSREVSPISGRSQQTLTVHFGLGAATLVDSVVVQWPSGSRRILVPGPAVDRRVAIVEPRVQMTNVASGTLAEAIWSKGAAWVDFDGDGDLDLFYGNDANPNRLMRNEGNFAFTDVTPSNLQDVSGTARTMAWGDYDNDGDPDVYVANNTPQTNKLFRNDGNGSFTDVTAQNPALGIALDSRAVSWVDIDNDGDLDLSVAGFYGNFLFRNDGPDEPFVNISSAIPTTSWNVEGATWGDFDNDGDMDFYIGRAGLPNRLVVNDGGGAFHDTTIAVVQDAGNVRGVAWGDFDNDGNLDLAVANVGGPLKLFHNEPGVGFADVTSLLPATQSFNAAALNWGDVNLDGRLDLLANGPGVTYAFVNLPTGFQADTIATGISVAYGMTLGDADRDGAPDLYAARQFANTLHRNTPIGNPHWLEVGLEGTTSSRSAIGARVYLYTGATMQMRELTTGTGYQSQNAVEAMFGLGSASTVDSIWIQWPSGTRQRLASVPADQYLSVTEMKFEASDGEFENRVALSWTGAASSNYYFIIRRDDDPNDLTPPVLLSYVSAGDSTYSDETAVPNVEYTYSIEQYQLPSRTLVATSVDVGSKHFFDPSDLQATVGTYADRVVVRWLDNSSIESGFRLTRTPSAYMVAGAATDTFPPLSVALDALEDSTRAFLFREQQDLVLASSLNLDATQTGLFAGNAGVQGTLPAGTVVTSYLLHADRVSTAANTVYSGSVTFDTPILGLIIKDPSLDTTDGLLGVPAVTYPAGLNARGPEGAESFALSVDRRTLTFTLRVPSVMDEVRIVVAGGGLSATLAPNVSGYNDVAAIPGVDYTYCLTAFTDFVQAGDTTRVWLAQLCDGGRRATILPPADVVASDGEDSTAVVINWRDQTDGEQGFWIYRDDTKIGFVEPNTTRFVDMALLGVPHVYCVQTVKDSTAGQLSDRICDSGIGGDSTLAVPLAFSATDSSFDDRVDLRWRDTENEGEFLIYRDGEILARLGADVVSFSDRTAMPGVRHGYRIIAAALVDTVRGYQGGTSIAAADSGTRIVIVAPTQVAATNGDHEDRVEVTWSSISTTAVLFTVYRDGEPIRTVPGHLRTASDDEVDTAPHLYSVTALTAAGVESEPAFDDDGIGARRIQAPASVQATDDEYENQVVVSWTDASKAETGYQVWRKVSGAAGDSAVVGTTDANRTSYVDLTGAPGATYLYSVNAVDPLGASAARSDEGRRTLAAPTRVAASAGEFENQIEITWSDQSRYEVGYLVYRRVSGDLADSVRVDSLGAGALSSVDDGSTQPLVLGEHYTYYVVAFDAYGASRSGSAEGYTQILAPASVSVSDTYTDKFVVSWVDRSSIETAYRIYRDGVLVQTTAANATSWTDTDLSGSGTRQYCVQSFCPTDESVQVCATGSLGGAVAVEVGGLTLANPIQGAGTIVPSINASSTFGWSVSMGRIQALVADPFALTPTDPSSTNGNAGAVFPFELVNGAWKRSGDPIYPPSSPNVNGSPAPSTDPSGAWFGGFGMSVAVSEDDKYAVIGDNTAQASGYRGRAYVYGSSGGSWSLLEILSGFDNNALDVEFEFGAEVAISGQTILVASAGVGHSKPSWVYLFNRDPATGSWQTGKTTLTPGNGDGTFGLTSRFTSGVAMNRPEVDQHRLAIDDGVAVVAGDDLLYVYERSGSGVWPTAPTQILDPNLTFHDAVAVSGRTIVVLSQFSAEVWEKKEGASSWARTGVFSFPGGSYRFGDVAIHGDVIVLGPQESQAPNAGWSEKQAALVFSRSEAGWVQVADIRPPASEYFYDNHLGTDIALNGEFLMIGGPINPMDVNVDGKLWIEKVPAVPTGVTASDATFARKIQVRWTDNASTEDGFRVYRDGEQIAETSPNVRLFDDSDVEPGRTYEYRVTSFTDRGYESGVAGSDYGRTKPDGTIGGRVATNAGSGVPGIDVRLEPPANNALLFDGVGGYLYAKGFAIPDTFTVDLWVNPRPGGTASLLSKTNGASNLFSLRLTSGGNVEVRSGASMVTTAATLERDQWQHLAVSAAFPTIKVYLDGDLIETLSLAATTDTKPTEGWTLGARWDGSTASEFFGGRMDEVRIWDRALTQAEIQADRFVKRTGTEQDLLACWPLDQFDEPALEDLTSNALYARAVDGVHWTAESAPLETFALTDIQGNYALGGLRYGTGAEFRVRPSGQERDFSPEYKTITLNAQTPVQNEVAFTDVTAHTISGTILYAGTTCPAADIPIAVDGVPRGATDRSGYFAVSVDQGPHTIAPVMDGHQFDPENYAFFASGDSAGLDFGDRTLRRLWGRVGGRCDGDSIGRVTFEIESDNLCLKRTVTTATGYDVLLPPGKYSIVVTGITDIPAELNPVAVERFFSELGALEADLTAGPDSVSVLYTAPLKIEISGWGPVTFTELRLPGDKRGALPDAVMDQTERLGLTIRVFEDYGNGHLCPLDTAEVVIYDEVIDNEDPVTVGLKDGVANYETAANTPNVFPGRTDLQGRNRSYQKALTVIVDVPGRAPVRQTDWVLVTGHRPRPSTFSTVAEGVPVLILRDPPGDHSYAYVEEGTTTCTIFNRIGQETLSGIKEATVRIGAKFATGFGYLALNTVQNYIIGKLEVGVSVTEDNKFQVCTTARERISTSALETFIGNDADLYAAVGINFSFAKTDVVDALVEGSICTVLPSVANSVGSNGVKSAVLYTEKHVRDVLIPQQQEIAASLRAENNENDALIWDSSVENLQHWLALNDSLRDEAEQVTNRSFSAGADLEYSETSTRSKAYTTTVNVFTDKELAAGYEFEYHGTGPSAKLGAKLRLDAIVETGSSSETSRTVGYVLSDDDIGDYFSVDVKEDPVHRTPVFEVSDVGTVGTSSCPWEPWTDPDTGLPRSQPRDGVDISLQPVEVGPYDPAQPVVFQLDMVNTSPSEEDREYVLFPIQTSNPGGAIIKVNGSGIAGGVSFFLPARQGSEATLTVERGPRKFDYKGLQIAIAPACEIDNWRNGGAMQLADTVTFDVDFEAPCSDIDMFQPLAGWNVNVVKDSLIIDLVDFTLAVGGKNDDSTKVDAIGASYKRTGTDDAPTTIQSIANTVGQPLDLEGERIIWYPPSNLPDGSYDVLAWTQCNGTKYYLSKATGKIDRGGPAVAGFTPPDDGTLVRNGKISVTFNEDIDCSKVTSSGTTPNVKVERSVDMGVNWLPVILKTASQSGVVCDGRTLTITPVSPKLDSLENQLLRVSLSGIQDLTGNALAADTSWSFGVQRNQFAWSPPLVSKDVPAGVPSSFEVTLVNGLSQDVDYEITGLPAWLMIPSTTGSLNALETGDLVFEIADNLTLGNAYDATVMATANEAGTNNPIVFSPLNVHLDVICGTPNWVVKPADYQYSMSVVADVKKGPLGNMAAALDDTVAAFVGNELRGVAAPIATPSGNRAFLTVYGKFAAGERIRFKVYDQSSCVTADASPVVQFVSQSVSGTVASPVTIATLNSVNTGEQMIPVVAGWNWFSLNRKANFTDGMDVAEVLGNLNPAPGDQVKNHFEGFATYTDSVGWQPLGGLDSLDVRSTYLLHVSQPGVIRHRGNPVDISTTPVPVDSGWTWIGYPLPRDTTLNAALQSLTRTTGDVIVGQDAFAQYDGTNWVGSLTAMQPGEGYKLYLQHVGAQDLFYPDQNAPGPLLVTNAPEADAQPGAVLAGGRTARGGPGSRVAGGFTMTAPSAEGSDYFWSVNPRRYRYNMTVSATVAFQDGRALDGRYLVLAIVNGEVRGMTRLRPYSASGALGAFMMVYGNAVSGEAVTFRVYDPNEQALYDASEALGFVPDASYGSYGGFVALSPGGPPEQVVRVPGVLQLAGNFPNPFRAGMESTLFRFGMPRAGRASLKVYDLAGRSRATLVDGRVEAGWHDVPFDGAKLPAGVYFYRLEAEGKSYSRKLLILR